jgi:hypothetical protein
VALGCDGLANRVCVPPAPVRDIGVGVRAEHAVENASGLSGSAEGKGSDMRALSIDAFRHAMTRLADFVLRRPRRLRPASYGGRHFTAPQLLSQACLPPDPGLYAIQVRNLLGELKVLHFGASDNLHEELMVDGHVGFMHWLGHRQAGRGVWISYHVADDLDPHRRHQEGERLNRHYFPERTHTLDEHVAHHRMHRSPARQHWEQGPHEEN